MGVPSIEIVYSQEKQNHFLLGMNDKLAMYKVNSCQQDVYLILKTAIQFILDVNFSRNRKLKT